ncbi:uncharacterized protein LOC143214621 isoform X2 [Lasioglossum baleicum]
MNFSWLDHLVICLVVICAGCYGASDTTNNAADTLVEGNDVLDLRLPKTIVPISYEIMLMPHLGDDFLFDGTTQINASVEETTDTITLNHGNINVDLLSVSYSDGNGARLDIMQSKHDQKTEKFSIKLKQPLKKGSKITIDFNYSGILRNDMIGFYRSSYVDSKGNVRWLAATQFHSKHARHAFPCFDEPSFKATFRIWILRSREHSSLSNMPFQETIPKEGMYWDVFFESIPMSTYLVAAVISDFSKLTAGNFSVWARPDAINQAKYALTIGPPALQYLSKLFQQEYQLPKMDMVAVPDFSAGAMENWGLVTYRESRMLYDKNTSSDIAKQGVASVIVHELTHMWFGNQVTPEWWSCLWLSEAFARYFQYFATAQIEKTWDMEKQFIVEQHQTALAADGVESSEPMTRNVLTFSQLEGAGDTITYNKGASIVRMMRLVFGNDIFEAVLRNYLKNNKEKKVAQPENLWIELQAEVNRQNKKLGAPVNQIMSTWTTKPGFPVLNISIENGIATVRQSRFLLRNLKSTPINSTWWIPITWASKSNPNFDNVTVSRWISEQQDTFKLGSEGEWVVLNVQSAGFYRANYDNASWYRIIDVLNSKDYRNISDVNRAAIVDDSLNLARAGLLEYKTALDGLKYLTQETNYLPFKSAFSGLTYLDRRFSGHQEYYEEFKVFVLSLIDNIYKNVGYVDRSGDDRLTVLLRSELNKWACNYGHEGCIETFKKEFEKWKSTNNLTIKPNQRAVAFCTAIRSGTKDDWEFLWNKYFNSNSAHEQADMIQALGCTEDPALRERLMLNALQSLEKSRIRRQDSASVFAAVSSSGYDGAVSILDFVQKYHKNMSEYNNGTGNIATILSTASQGFATPEAVDKFENLINTHQTEFKDIASSLNNSLEIAKYDLLWFNKNKDDIMSWISYNKKTITDDKKTTGYRLPNSFAPSTYSVHVTPAINSFTFTGEVYIVAEVKEKTNKIVLHSAVDKHNNVTVSVGNTVLEIKSNNTIKEYDFLEIVLNQELTVGQSVNIYISFDGTINDKGRGFYRSWYLTDSGERRWIAATQMEPVGARKMFPCFDEPALKAKFTMKVTVQKEYDAISNTQMDNVIKHPDGRKTVSFKETPKMSTYLVVLIVSDFEGVTSYERYTVWARSNAIEQTYYALSVMQPIVQFYENTLNIPYQFDKLDMVALPDFVSGAMENWGLLTYKERNLLYLDSESTLPTKQSITNVISHEIAHQWFGNMVSPLWWKYTWLNEGFARFFQYFGTETAMPDWSLESQFVVDQVHTAFSVDSSSTSHPMTHDVESPTEISGMFDNISYNKGGSVLRMIKAAIGDSVFYKSLENYLKKRQYDSATPEDLFDAFKDQITNGKVKNLIHDIMNSWTLQAGFPVVHVSVLGKTLTLSQKQFLTDGKNSNKTWHIPITWGIVGKTNFTNVTPNHHHWLSKISENVDIARSSTDLVIVNLRQLGFYRTNYDKDHWQLLIDHLKSENYKQIHEINRAGIIDDLINFGKIGLVDYDTVLTATQYLVNETHYVPLKAFFTGLSFLRRHFEGRTAHGAFKRYVTGIIGPVYDRLGFYEHASDTHERKLLRIQLRKWACDMGIGDCEDLATQLFLLGTKIEPNYRSVAYCVIARKNDNEYWEILNDQYLKATVASEKALILQSLACATSKELLNKLLKTAISQDFIIRKEDSTGVFSNVIEASLDGVVTVMDFVRNNYDDMVGYYNGTSEIKSIVNSVGRRVTNEDLYTKYDNLMKWLNGKDDSFNSTRTVADKERVWAAKYIPQLHKWMERNYPETNYRLPKLFSPSLYNISISKIEFEEGNFTFAGKVRITMQSLQETSIIVLNSNELNIVAVKVYDKDTKEDLSLGDHLLNSTTETLTVFMNKLVHKKTIILEIEYTGNLNEDMIGFYRSYYKDNNKNIHWLATTQFQATHARNAFPCFDEPAYKARFSIKIERPDNYVALSNMPSAEVTPSTVAGRVWERFHDTVPMSTYALAFVVSDFESVGNTNVNVWSKPNMASSGDYAQKTAESMLAHLHEKTGIEYALPKLDLVAVPDFSMGAMENWGLATFREYGLQYNDAITSAKFKDYVTTIIAHELAHMWFGNLVTCAWWENTWLNEGFAEYMQWIISDMVLPDHKFLDLFVVDELQKAMQADDYTSSHPMNKPVNSPSDIWGVFDGITYGKGSSVLRMVQRSLDPRVFPMAINLYLERHKYSTTTPKDLWQAFDEAIEETKTLGDLEVSMEELMDSWTNQAGYPVVYATRTNGTVLLTQERFSYKELQDSRMVSYWIPISVYTASSTSSRLEATTWMDIAAKQIQVNSSEWFIINYQQTGFYRVRYDTDSWKKLTNALTKKDYSNIHVTNRAQLVDDAFNLARAQKMGYDEAFDCTNYLRNETEYLPWKAFFNGISFLLQRSEGHTDEVYSVIRSYILHLTSRMYQSLGFNDASNDSHMRQLSRELILTWICKMEAKECIDEVKKLYVDLQTNTTLGRPVTISPNAKAAVYCTAMRNADENDWNYMWNLYLNEKFASEKKTILEALGCTTNKELLQKYIDRAIRGSFTSDIRKQDVTAVLTSIYNAGKVGVDIMSDYLMNEYIQLHDYYGEWDSVGSLFTKLAARISTVQQLRKFEQFVNSDKSDLQEISSTLKKAYDTAKENVYWYDNNFYSVKYILNNTVTRWNQESSGTTINGYRGLLLIMFSIVTFMLH